MYIVYVQIGSDFVCVWRVGTRGMIGDGDKVPVCMRDLSPAKLKVKCFKFLIDSDYNLKLRKSDV